MEKIPKLILQLCSESTTAEELAEKLHCLRLIDVHKLKYLIIYKYFQDRRNEGHGIMSAMYDAAAYFNVSLKQIERVRKYVKTFELIVEADIPSPPPFI